MRTITLLLALIASPLLAQEARPDFAQKVAPFLDEHTLAVARVDVANMPVEVLTQFLTNYLGVVENENFAATMRAWVKDFKGKGGRDVFFTYGANDFPHRPILWAPIGATPKERKDLGELLKLVIDDEGATIEHRDGCVGAGTRDALANLKGRQAAARPDLLEALNVGKDAPAQFVFTLTKDARKIHEQIVPHLPDDLGGADIKTITRGFKWLSMTLEPGPKTPLKIVIEGADAEAIQKLQPMLGKVPDVMGKLLSGGEDHEQAALMRKKWDTLHKGMSSVSEGKRLTVTVDFGTAINTIAQSPDAKLAADRIRSSNNLKQLMLAIHNYHDTNNHFPTDIRDKDGKPLLSWRVSMLPYLEEGALYKQFKLDEPWDSEHNKKLLPKMPKQLRSPRQAPTLADRTTYLAPLGKGFMWDGPKVIKFADVTDGLSNTITLIEADDEHAAIWTKPEDLTLNMKDPSKGLLAHYGTGFLTAYGDGSVQFMPKSVPPADLWAMFTRGGGEVIKFPK